MKLIPQDLPDEWMVRFVQLRDAPQKPLEGMPEPRHGPLDRWVTSMSGLSNGGAALAAAAARNQYAILVPFGIWTAMAVMVALLSLFRGEPSAAVIASGVGATLSMAGLFGSREMFMRLLRRPIKPEEVERLLGFVSDPTARQFLELVRDAARQPVPGEAEADVREALRALADAMSRLPVIQRPTLDVEAETQEAAELEIRADQEADTVVADSFRRRAAAIRSRVESYRRSSVVAARSEALRAEIESQIAALREGLAAYDTPTHDAGSMARLAQSARQVAVEAGSVADAREELESGRSPAALVNSRPEGEKTVRLGVGSTGGPTSD